MEKTKNEAKTAAETEEAHFTIEPVRPHSVALAVIFASLVVAASIGVFGIIASIIGNAIRDNSISGMFAVLVVLIMATLYLALPPLMNSRFGWKAVVWTYVVQSFFVMIILMATVALMTVILAPPSSSSNSSSTYRSSCRSSLNPECMLID